MKIIEKNILFVLLFVAISTITIAQTENEVLQKSDNKKEFKPSGTPFIIVFSNFHTDMTKDKESSAFELNRAYLGYKCQMSKNFSANVTFDVADPGTASSLNNTAFVKMAALTYKNNKGNLSFDFGMIGLKQFNTQRGYWGHRYIYKTIQNQHKFGYTADMGACISYKLHKILSVDASIMNGEGYKNIQVDNTYKGGFGLTITPVKNLIIREYYDIYQKSETQWTISSFIGYQFKEKLTLGAEYDIQNNHYFVKDNNLTGISAYISYIINKKFEIFGRFDNLSSNKISSDSTSWNITKDGNAIISGIQYSPVKNIKIAANYQMWRPKLSGSNDEPKIYLNLEYKF